MTPIRRLRCSAAGPSTCNRHVSWLLGLTPCSACATVPCCLLSTSSLHFDQVRASNRTQRAHSAHTAWLTACFDSMPASARILLLASGSQRAAMARAVTCSSLMNVDSALSSSMRLLLVAERVLWFCKSTFKYIFGGYEFLSTQGSINSVNVLQGCAANLGTVHEVHCTASSAMVVDISCPCYSIVQIIFGSPGEARGQAKLLMTGLIDSVSSKS